MKFGVRVMEAVREKVGSDFIVGTRITGDDLTERRTGQRPDAGDLRTGSTDLKLLDYFNVIGATCRDVRGRKPRPCQT